ncbi:MAG: ATP-dependent RecD-like DNA helicase [Solirubrobacterales bacterium]
MESIQGHLETITYANEETGFVVARLREKDKPEPTTVVGNLIAVTPGETLILHGRWVQNKRFGLQFAVDSFETMVPATLIGIEKYLGSGLIHGIGTVMAKRLVKAFGLDTLTVIDQEPARLTQVEGIGPKRIGMITAAWEEQRDVKDIMVFLQGHGVSAAYAAKIFKRYGKESIAVVRENPYRLAADIAGIGFLTADKIGREIGIEPDSLLRAEEGVLHVLSELMDEGHIYYPYDALVERAVQILAVPRDIVLQGIARLFENRRIIIEDLALDPDAENDKAVYLTQYYHAETALARMLIQLSESSSDEAILSDPPDFPTVEREMNLELAPRQREAVAAAVSGKLVVVTGGPGTGKTTIIRAMLKVFDAMNRKVLLAAPTGRAARRMKDATGLEAKTIHRLLEFSPQKGNFQRDPDNPVETDVLIVDEASMIDLMLMYQLVRGLPPEARLILVGDVNQLPSVGPGSVLRDIISSGTVPVITLNEIFRQASRSRIVTNAHLINSGLMPDLVNPAREETGDFYFIHEEEPDGIVDKIVTLCKERIPKRFGLDPIRDVQVLTPMRRGTTGTANLNAELQKALNPSGESVVRAGRMYRIGDKVMQIVNNYDKDIYNGDYGVVSRIERERQAMAVDFEGREVLYDFAELDELVLSYAVSVHKSQGSEYPAVVIPFSTQHFIMLQRNLLYTGITRGRKLVVLLGTKKALAIAVKNDRPQVRHTRLAQRLRQTVPV